LIENGTLESDPIQALRNGNLIRSLDTEPAPARVLGGTAGDQHHDYLTC
jgi:hypothetical protein